MEGYFACVGLGPGQLDAVTPRARQVLNESDIVYLMSREGTPAHKLVVDLLDEPSKIRLFLPKNLRWGEWGDAPELLSAFDSMLSEAAAGRRVAFPVIGDSTIYSPFGYLLDKLRASGLPYEVVPGIPVFVATGQASGDWLVRDEGGLLLVGAPNLERLEDAFASASTVILYAADMDAVRAALGFARRYGLQSAQFIRLAASGSGHGVIDLLTDDPTVAGGTVILKRWPGQRFERKSYVFADRAADCLVEMNTVMREGVYRVLDDGVPLRFTGFFPEGKVEVPVCVMFHGGGWQIGNRGQFVALGQAFAACGIALITCDYRISSVHGGTPFDSVEDAQEAVRWIHANAAELGVDPERIVVGGASAGGHVAVGVSVFGPAEVASVPRAYVLLNPVTDTSEKGYGYDVIPNDPSQLDVNLRMDHVLPPCIVLHGAVDQLVPFQNSCDFVTKARALGTNVHFHLYPGLPHGFFNHDFQGTRRWYYDSAERIVAFLADLGICEAEVVERLKLLNERDRHASLVDAAINAAAVKDQIESLREDLADMAEDLKARTLDAESAVVGQKQILNNIKAMIGRVNTISNTLSYQKA